MTNSNPTFSGFVDRAIIRSSPDGLSRLDIYGWLLSPDAKIKRLELWINPLERFPADQTERADVAQKISTVAHALYSGFFVSLPVDMIQTNYTVQFFAVLENGSEISSSFSIQPSNQHTLNSKSNSVSEFVFGSTESRNSFALQCQLKLKSLLISGTKLTFPKITSPVISVVIPLFNQPHLLLATLEALKAQSTSELEIIIVDNNSNSSTKELLTIIEGAKIIQNQSNMGFAIACNQGAQAANGEFLLFLNSDAIPLPGALEAALKIFKCNTRIGAVGAKLLRCDGKLQEAGAYVLPNGTTVALGRGASPWSDRYSKTSLVDYCSAAFLLTPKKLFMDIGQFDERFFPAYFEDVEYCSRLARIGFKTAMCAQSLVLHVERGSSESPDSADKLIEQNRSLYLSCVKQSKPLNQLTLPKEIKLTEQNILVIDDVEPDPAKGQGQGRSLLLLTSLCEICPNILFYPANQSWDTSKSKSATPWTTIKPHNNEGEFDFLRRTFLDVQLVIVSRPTHMEVVDSVLRSLPIIEKSPTIIYDAEALQSKRVILKHEILNETEFSDDEIVEVVSQELCLAVSADKISTVSPQEAQVFKDFGFNNVSVLGYGVSITPSDTPFAKRKGLLTVGPMHKPDTPNSDANRWFINNVLPWLAKLIENDPIVLHAVGENQLAEFDQMQSCEFRLLGHIRDLAPIYANHRVFVAPTRYSAGIPIKVIEAAAHGIPIVASPLVASQLGWKDEQELLIGYSAQDFAAKCAALHRNEALWQQLRDSALKRVQEQFSISNFKSSLRQILLYSSLHN